MDDQHRRADIFEAKGQARHIEASMSRGEWFANTDGVRSEPDPKWGMRRHVINFEIGLRQAEI